MRYLLTATLLVFAGCRGSSTTAGQDSAGGLNSGASALAQYQSDPFNCGGSNKVCTGVLPGCSQGQCVDLANDNTNCGEPGYQCHSSATCVPDEIGVGRCVSASDLTWATGRCDINAWQQYCGCHCKDGVTVIPTGSCSAYYADPALAQKSCGQECDNSCINHGGSINACNNYYYFDFRSQCTALNQTLVVEQSCPPGYANCNDQCKYLASDPNNCGVCGNVCTGVANKCVEGACVSENQQKCYGSTPTLNSSTGKMQCSDGCMYVDSRNTSDFVFAHPCIPSACSDYSPSANVLLPIPQDGIDLRLGNQCGIFSGVYGRDTGMQCSGCGNKCVDLNSDVNNCGSCGYSCNVSGSMCMYGRCNSPGFLNCQAHQQINDCKSDSNCIWMTDGNGCVSGKCSDYADLNTCTNEAPSGCAWNYANNTCYTTCGGFQDSNSCNANPDCIWIVQQCNPSSCFGLNQNDCTSGTYPCVWQNNQCIKNQ